MATQNIRRNVSGTNQTPAGVDRVSTVLSDWTNADGWVATVELIIVGIGVSSEQTDIYYRREVFKWTDGAASPAALGALVANTILEEDSVWDAHIALSASVVQVHLVADAAEKINWTWSGTITLQKVE
jgi:hypothetical protein